MRHFGKLSLQIPFEFLPPDWERVEQAAQDDSRPHRSGRWYLGHNDSVGIIDDLGALVSGLVSRGHTEFRECAQRAQRFSTEAKRVYGCHITEV